MIEIVGLSHSFKEVQLLKEINLSVRQGERIVVFGRSGAGKSTFLKLIGGFLQIQKGQISFENKKIKGPDEVLIPGNQEIQLVAQDFGLDLYHTTFQNIQNKTNHLSQKHQLKFIDELLELLELKHVKNSVALNISGGEQQRLCIARALAVEPKVILFDEPFVHLDIHIKKKLIYYLNELHKIRNTTFILVTHDAREAFQFCSRGIYIQKGKIKRDSGLYQFYKHPKSMEEGAFFGEMNKVHKNGKRIFFRPNEFRISTEKNENSIELIVNRSFFDGSSFMNECETIGKELVLLSSNQPYTLKKCILIDILQ